MNPSSQLSLFFNMLRIRRIEEAISLHYAEQKMRCPIHLSIGQEAIAVGICTQLTETDSLFSNHRSHAHYLAKGGNLQKMLAELYGKQTGCTKGRGGSMHLIDLKVGFQGSSSIAAGSIPIAAGFAFANQMRKLSAICCSFFGEAATEEGVFAETLNFAALKNIPLLLICENNSYAGHSPTSERQVKNCRRVKTAKAHQIFTLVGNGNDIEETFEIAKKTIQYVRNECKPAFIEFETYRFCEHVRSYKPDPIHRSQEELNTWKKRCPIKLYQKKLMNNDILSSEILDTMETKISSEISDAFSFAEESPFPIFDLDDEKVYTG